MHTTVDSMLVTAKGHAMLRIFCSSHILNLGVTSSFGFCFPALSHKPMQSNGHAKENGQSFST